MVARPLVSHLCRLYLSHSDSLADNEITTGDAKKEEKKGGDKAAAPAKEEKKGGDKAAKGEAKPAAPAAAKEDKKGGEKKEAAPAGEKKEKEKKEGGEKKGGEKKAAAAPTSPEDEERVDQLDIRVGTIVKVGKHPDADALYLGTSGLLTYMCMDLIEQTPSKVSVVIVYCILNFTCNRGDRCG